MVLAYAHFFITWVYPISGTGLIPVKKNPAEAG